MKFITSLILVLALLQQSLMPAVACELCACCDPVAWLSGSQAGDSQRSLTTCCGTLPARSGDLESLSASVSCCATGIEAVAEAESCCCELNPGSDSSVYQLESSRLVFSDWLAFGLGTVNETVSVSTEAPSNEILGSIDDRTRPARSSRCHLLDCVWLI